jgi:hypothetical protein
MYKLIVQIICVVLFARRPDIAIIVEVALLNSIHCREKTVTSNVELSLLNEERSFYIFLDNECGIIS